MFIPRKRFDWDAEWTPLEIRVRLAALIVEERRIHGSVSEQDFRVRFGRGVPGDNRAWYVATIRPAKRGSHIHASVAPHSWIFLAMAVCPVFFGGGMILTAYVLIQRVLGRPLADEVGLALTGLGVSAAAGLAYAVYRASFRLDAEELNEYLRTKLRR